MKSAKELVPDGASEIRVPSENTSWLLRQIYECVPSLQESDDPEQVMLPDYEKLTTLRDVCNSLLAMGAASFEVHHDCYSDLQNAAVDKTARNPKTLSCGCRECLYKTLSIKHEIDYARSGRGKVYLMRNQRNGYVKIGFTRRIPEIRERTLQAEEPDITLICTWPGTTSDESRLHKMFAHRRLRGEWFALTDNEFDELLKMEFGYGLNDVQQVRHDDVVQ